MFGVKKLIIRRSDLWILEIYYYTDTNINTVQDVEDILSMTNSSCGSWMAIATVSVT
jgi:hypothetical protein